jgi:ribonuclease VapC
MIKGEPAALRLAELLDGAFMSAVNYGEVVAKLSEAGVPASDIAAQTAQLGFTVLPHDQADATAAGLLRLITRAAGLSMGDRACLALAAKLAAVALTADRAWQAVQSDVPVTIQFIR